MKPNTILVSVCAHVVVVCVIERVLAEGYDLTNAQVSGGTGCPMGAGTGCG